MNNRESIKAKIKVNYVNFTKKEKKIGDYILDNPKDISKMTISDIASRLEIADSTVFLFTRKLGYKSFRDFRNDLLFEEYDPEISVHENIKGTDSDLEMALKVFDSSIKSLNDTKTLLKEEKLKEASNILLSSKLISFFGVGGSNVVCFDAYHKYLRTPLHVQYAQDYHIQLMQASLLDENDCAIVVTHTGLTKEALKLAKTAKENEAKVIALTGNASNELKKYADVLFMSVADETGYRSESLTSRIAQQTLLDVLYTIIMFHYDEEKVNETLYKIRGIVNSTKIDK